VALARQVVARPVIWGGLATVALLAPVSRRSRWPEITADACAPRPKGNSATSSTTQARMRYRWFRSRGLFTGSGVVEAGCKSIVGQRLEQAGMH